AGPSPVSIHFALLSSHRIILPHLPPLRIVKELRRTLAVARGGRQYASSDARTPMHVASMMTVVGHVPHAGQPNASSGSSSASRYLLFSLSISVSLSLSQSLSRSLSLS